jgi:hypothetical protein
MNIENESEAIVEAFIDDAGNTGNDLENSEQRNLVLACLVVPSTRASAFWSRVGAAWQIATSVTGLVDIELKGEQIFGGRGPFEGVSLEDRRRVLDAVVEAVLGEKTYVFWQGMPKHLWREMTTETPLLLADSDFWKTVLLTFLNQVYGVFDHLYGPCNFGVTADENSWITAENVLSLSETWPRLLNRGVVFRRSNDIRGLQVADIIAHSLYRKNRDACPAPNKPPVTLSKTDKLAASYIERLEAGGILVPLLEATTRLGIARTHPARDESF